MAQPEQGSSIAKVEGAVDFDAVYRQHSQRLFVLCMRFANGDRDWALDRVHDTFVKLGERREQLCDIPDLGGWLYRVATNECLMRLRRMKTWRRLLPDLSDSRRTYSPSPESAHAAKRDLTRLEIALDTLPPKQAAVFILVHLEEKTQAEAGRILGISKAQTSRLHRKAQETLSAIDWEIER